MSENPYQSPLVDVEVVGVRSGRREDLRSVALYQKGVIVCILLNILVVLGHFFLSEVLGSLLLLGMFATGIVGLMFVVLLSLKVYHPVVGILFGIVTLWPCIGLLALLAIDNRATKVLKKNGYRVGLLGASLSQFRED
jgi:hypothetical protein